MFTRSVDINNTGACNEAEDDQKGEIIYIKQVRMNFITNPLSLRSLHHKKVEFYFLSQIKMTHNVQISLRHKDD